MRLGGTAARSETTSARPPAPERVTVVRMSGRGLPDANRLQDLLGNSCLVVGAHREARVVVLGSPPVSEIRMVRAEQPESLVVVLLTAEAEAGELVAAYDAGADLVAKGAESRELAARVRALLRRQGRDLGTAS